MQILADLEAERHCGGGIFDVTISPTFNITTGLVGLLQLNNGANVAAAVGGSADAALVQKSFGRGSSLFS